MASIEGVVKDSSGAVLPGVTVEAKTGTGVVLTATTDAQGVYRFPSLAARHYTSVRRIFRASRPAKVRDVQVGLGQIKKVDFGLGVAGVSETVQVTAESPLVDVKQSGAPDEHPRRAG